MRTSIVALKVCLPNDLNKPVVLRKYNDCSKQDKGFTGIACLVFVSEH